MPASCGKGPETLPTEGQQAQRSRAMSPPVHQFLTQLKLESKAGEHQACLQRPWDTNHTEAASSAQHTVGQFRELQELEWVQGPAQPTGHVGAASLYCRTL